MSGSKVLPAIHYIKYMHTVKKRFHDFPSPAGISLTKLSLAGNNVPNPSPWKVWSKKSRNLVIFLQCTVHKPILKS